MAIMFLTSDDLHDLAVQIGALEDRVAALEAASQPDPQPEPQPEPDPQPEPEPDPQPEPEPDGEREPIVETLPDTATPNDLAPYLLAGITTAGTTEPLDARGATGAGAAYATLPGPQHYTIPAQAEDIIPHISDNRLQRPGVYRLDQMLPSIAIEAPCTIFLGEGGVLGDRQVRPHTVMVRVPEVHLRGGTVYGPARDTPDGNTGLHAIYVEASDFSSEDQYIIGTGTHRSLTTKEGVQAKRDKTVHRCIVRRARLRNFVDGISLQGGEGMHVAGCVISECWDDGLEFDYSTSGSCVDTIFADTVFSNISWQGAPTGVAPDGTLGRYVVRNCQLTGTRYRSYYFASGQMYGGSPIKNRAAVQVELLGNTIIGLNPQSYANTFFLPGSKVLRNLLIWRGPVSWFENARVDGELPPQLDIECDYNVYDFDHRFLWNYPGMQDLPRLRESGYEANGRLL